MMSPYPHKPHHLWSKVLGHRKSFILQHSHQVQAMPHQPPSHFCPPTNILNHFTIRMNHLPHQCLSFMIQPPQSTNQHHPATVHPPHCMTHPLQHMVHQPHTTHPPAIALLPHTMNLPLHQSMNHPPPPSMNHLPPLSMNHPPHQCMMHPLCMSLLLHQHTNPRR